MLIQIDDGLIVSTDIIEKACRNGNYTDIFNTENQFWQILDEDKSLWKRLQAACVTEKDAEL